MLKIVVLLRSFKITINQTNTSTKKNKGIQIERISKNERREQNTWPKYNKTMPGCISFEARQIDITTNRLNSERHIKLHIKKK